MLALSDIVTYNGKIVPFVVFINDIDISVIDRKGAAISFELESFHLVLPDPNDSEKREIVEYIKRDSYFKDRVLYAVLLSKKKEKEKHRKHFRENIAYLILFFAASVLGYWVCAIFK